MENLDAKKLDQAAGHLEKAAEDKGLQREAKEFAEMLYHNKAFKKFARGWEKLPHAAQWGILKGQQMVPIAVPWLQALIQMGLLKYKGHASVEDREESIAEEKVWQQRGQKLALNIAALFQPEIKAVLPLLGPLEKFQNSKAAVFEGVRRHIDQIEREVEGKETRIINGMNGPKPANDNATEDLQEAA